MRKVHGYLQYLMLAVLFSLFGPGCMEDTPDPSSVAQPAVTARTPIYGSRIIGNLSGSQLRTAYKITGHGSSSTKVAVIIGGGYDPTRAASDVGAARNAAGLHSGQSLQVVNQSGNTSPLPNTISQSWELAAAAGLQIALTMADDVTPILVVCDSAAWSDLDLGIKRAKTMGAVRIVMPFTLADQGDGTTFATGALYFAGTDMGSSLTFPALSAKVVSVAPTTLQADQSQRGYAEAFTSGAAVGCSTRSKPAFQTDSICSSNRTVPDVAAVGDSDTPVVVYYTPAGGSQQAVDVAGPAVSAAVIAGWFALDPGATVDDLYAITIGTDTFDLDNTGFDAHTGLGAPNQDAAF